MRIRHVMLFVGAGAVLAGCGGTSAKYRVDDVALAQVPISEKQAIFTAQNDVSVARSEREKALADARQTEGEIEIAGKEKEQARLEREKAKLEKEAAEKSRDMNRVAASDRSLKVAELGEKTGNAKVYWLEGKRKWQKKMAEVAEEQEAVANSKVELEKAKLAVSRNIKPTNDFNLTNFTADYANKEKRAAEARQEADAARTEMEKREQAYNNLKAQYAEQRNQLAGGSSPMPPAPAPAPMAPAPMAPAPAPAPAPSAAPAPAPAATAK